jgi:hypothetical protein
LRTQEALDHALQLITAGFRALVTSAVAEDRNSVGTAPRLHPRPDRGRVVDAAGRQPFSAEFVWRWPPPSAANNRSVGRTGTERRSPFIACSVKLPNHWRIFVFPPPMNAVVLPDEEVSWYFQVPLAALSPEEREREMEYREKAGIQFPMESLPK